MSTISHAPSISFPDCGLFLAAATGFVLSLRVALTFLWFQSDPEQGSVVSIALSILLLGCACWTALIYPTPDFASTNANRALKLVFAYLVLSGVSLSWSSTRSVLVAMGYWAQTTADVLTLVLLSRYAPQPDRLRRVLAGYVAGAAVVAVIAWVTPPMYDLRLGNEDFLHPNAIGFVFALAALFAMYLAREHAFWKWMSIALSITLLRSLSKACIVAYSAAAVFYLLRGVSLTRRERVIILLITAITLVALWGVIASYATFYNSGTANVETLTGRTIIWALSFEIAKETPWIGHGFYSYRFVVPPFGEFEGWHAHNELLQQFFNYGVFGVFLTIALYYALYRQIRFGGDASVRTLTGALMLFALIRGAVDTERFDLSFPLWLIAALSIQLAKPNPQRNSSL